MPQPQGNVLACDFGAKKCTLDRKEFHGVISLNVVAIRAQPRPQHVRDLVDAAERSIREHGDDPFQSVAEHADYVATTDDTEAMTESAARKALQELEARGLLPAGSNPPSAGGGVDAVAMSDRTASVSAAPGSVLRCRTLPVASSPPPPGWTAHHRLLCTIGPG